MPEYISPELVDKQGANPGAAIPKSSYVDGKWYEISRK